MFWKIILGLYLFNVVCTMIIVTAICIRVNNFCRNDREYKELIQQAKSLGYKEINYGILELILVVFIPIVHLFFILGYAFENNLVDDLLIQSVDKEKEKFKKYIADWSEK